MQLNNSLIFELANKPINQQKYHSKRILELNQMEQNEEKSEFRVSGSLFMFMVTEGGFPKSEVDTFCKI